LVAMGVGALIYPLSKYYGAHGSGFSWGCLNLDFPILLSLRSFTEFRRISTRACTYDFTKEYETDFVSFVTLCHNTYLSLSLTLGVGNPRISPKALGDAT